MPLSPMKRLPSGLGMFGLGSWRTRSKSAKLKTRPTNPEGAGGAFAAARAPRGKIAEILAFGDPGDFGVRRQSVVPEQFQRRHVAAGGKIEADDRLLGEHEI